MSNIYDMADTWNDAGETFTAIKMNVTDTASNAASLLMDLQVGGVSRYKVDKTGVQSSTATRGPFFKAAAPLVAEKFVLGGGSAAGGVTGLASSGQVVMLVGAKYALGNKNDAFEMASAARLGWSSTPGSGHASSAISGDLYAFRAAAGILGLHGTASTVGAAAQLREMTAPAAPAADHVRIYAEDDGAGKTRLMALFPTGAAQQIAIEP